MILGKNLKIKYPYQVTLQEANKDFLKKEFEKYDKQPSTRTFKNPPSTDYNGGIDVKAVIETYQLNGYKPNKAFSNKGRYGFNAKLKEELKTNKFLLMPTNVY